MQPRFTAGATVRTPLGKGIVREVRNRGSLLIDIGNRTVVLDETAVSLLEARPTRRGEPELPGGQALDAQRTHCAAARDIDLHGLTVEQAIARADQALNDALLADAAEIRFIHGKSGGRIRAALHRRLRDSPSVRAFRLDPRNPGVTVVSL